NSDNYREGEEEKIMGYDDGVEDGEEIEKSKGSENERKEGLEELINGERWLNGLERLNDGRRGGLEYMK
ncbi:hypothetical protein, partial [Staphylococcus epidermidis]|uniref:hypothetical protein n=1 Tax=Staphylococcus epidermidis TaxID=1282 RepID=UPI001C92BF30